MKEQFITPQGKIVNEEQLLELFEKENSHCAESLWKLAVYYSKTKRQKKALGCIKKLKNLTDDFEKIAKLLVAQGQLMEQIEDYATASEYYREAISFGAIYDTRTRYFINNNLGFCLNIMGKYAEAEGYLHNAIEIEPDLANAYKNLGICFKDQKEYVKSANCFMTATQVNSSDIRSFRFLEDLIKEKPELLVIIPELKKIV